jgi:RimJ/RimL family protein N-acetyltransferase
MANIVGWVGERVRLIPSDRSLHLENALRWFNDPEVTRRLALNLGVTRTAEEAFFERIERAQPECWHWAILDDHARHIGFISLENVDLLRRCASGGLVLGERDAWGQGYATDAVRVRTRFAFDQLGLHRIEGHTICPAMCRVYEKCGYVREGVARQKLWREGRWHDAALYSVLESDPRP